jgi:hypothetical protein
VVYKLKKYIWLVIYLEIKINYGIIGFMSQIYLLTPAFRLGTKYQRFSGFSPDYSFQNTDRFMAKAQVFCFLIPSLKAGVKAYFAT